MLIGSVAMAGTSPAHRKIRFRPRGHVAVVRPVAGAATMGLDCGLPGPPPGPAKIECGSQAVTVSNAAISLTWTFAPGGLQCKSLCDKQSGRVLPLAGEGFVVVLTDGRRYPASAMRPEGRPRESRLMPDPTAAHLAMRIAGQQVELPLRSAGWIAAHGLATLSCTTGQTTSARKSICSLRWKTWRSSRSSGSIGPCPRHAPRGAWTGRRSWPAISFLAAKTRTR